MLQSRHRTRSNSFHFTSQWADTWYGQLYKLISAHPIKEARIKGFSPIQPYQVATNLAITDWCLAFCWPSLSKLNDEVAPFHWESDDEHQWYMDKNSISLLPAFTTGPPPAAPIHPIPAIPSILLLVAAIVQNTDCLFFISCKFCNNNAREWRLAWVAFMESMSLYPSCTPDGRFLFKFYICHPDDWCYNAINQWYWLQLHSVSNLAFPRLTTETHLVWPTDSSNSYAAHHKLMRFRKWLNICHMDTYIHGPFDFASVRGHKTRDCVSQTDWDVLYCHQLMFYNPVPSFNVPTYSMYFDCSAHIVFHNEAACKLLLIELSWMFNTEDIYGSPWQKVLGLVRCPTPVFSFCTLFVSCMPFV